MDQGTRGPATVMAEILILVDQTRGDQGTRPDQRGPEGPGDQGTRGPAMAEIVEKRGPGDQGTRGPAMAEILILVDQTRGDQRDRRWLR